MSILHIVKCEQCENTHTISLMNKSAEWRQLPRPWHTLFPGDGEDGWHFCSGNHLLDWICDRWQLKASPAQQEPQEQPACKARRFLLVYGNANITEGVKWEDGSVSLQTARTWVSWEKFKAAHDGSGVQWIDQEVAE